MKRIVCMNQMFLRRVGLSVGLGLLFLCLCIAPAMAERVVLPESLTEIADEAFLNNASITSVEIPFGAERIGARAFAGCENLEEIIVPATVQEIGEDAFSGCDELTILCRSGSVAETYAIEKGITYGPYVNTTIPEGLEYTVYDTYAEITGFDRYSYPNMFTLTLPDVIEGVPVTSIASYAFYGCNRMVGIVLPNQLTSIDQFAFSDCTNLIEVELPDSVTLLGGCAFEGCTSLQIVNYPLHWSSTGPSSSYYTEASPFKGCKLIKNIDIPEGVTSIPAYAFEDTGVTTVSLPKTLSSIGEYAFSKTLLESIVIPENVVIIREGTFSNCNNLILVELPDGLTAIEEYAFESCINLVNISLPDSITILESYAFKNCSLLSNINYPYNWESVNGFSIYSASPFSGCPRLTHINIPEGVTIIPQSAFAHTNISFVTLPSTLKEIGECAFHYTLLYGVNIPEGVTVIRRETFGNCKNLSQISLPSTLESIEYQAFSFCENLEKIVLPNSITTLSPDAFYECSSLIDVTYPKNWVTTPYSYQNRSPFFACPQIKQITITDGTVELPEYAFADTYLEKIYIPSSVSKINMYALNSLAENLTIYGVSGSHAESYAVARGIPFVPGRIPTADYGDTDAAFTITVLAPDGTLVDRAAVQAYASDNDMLVGSAVTDESGVCSISGLQKGRLYYFVCRKAPFSFADTYESTDTQSASVTIRANPMNEAYALASPASATIDAAGGSAEFAVSASGAWTVSCDADWLTLSTAGGSDGALLTVTAAANTGYLRAAEVLLNTENVTTAFYVYQTGDLGARLPDPVITSPSENDMILPYGDVTISWDPVEGAEEYAVSLRDLDTDTLMLFHESQKDATSVTFLAGYLNGDCRYRVAVAAVPAGATTKDSVTSWRERTFAVSAQEVPGTSSLSGYVYELITPEAVAAYAVRTSSISSDTKDAVVRAAASADGLDTSPLANVTVTVMTEVDQTIVGTATTDAEGYWIMPELTPGESYRIELKKDGFAFRVAYFRYDTVPGENAVKPIYAYDENMDYEGAIGTLLISYDDQLKMNGSIREHGLFAEYFQYSNSKKFVTAEKRNEGIVDNIDFSWKGDVNDDVSGVSYRELKVYDFEDEGKGTHKEIIDYVPQKFSARFNGYLMVRDPEAYAGMTWYKFRVRGDDGVRLIMRTDDYTQLPGKYEDWGNGSNNIAIAEPEGMLYVNQVLSVTIEYYNHEGWFDKSNLIFEYSKDYGVSDKDSTWYTVPTDWLYCGNRTVEVSDVAGANYALRLLEANKKIADYSKTTIQDFVELIADEMIGGKVIDMYSELNGSGKLAGSYLATILNNINETIGDEVAEAVYEAVGMGVAGTMTEETMWQQIWTNVCGIGGDLVEDWFDPGMSQGIDNMNNLVKLTAYLKNLKNQDDLLDRIWGAVQNIPEFNTDNMGEISRDNIFLALIVGESKEDNIFSDAVYDSIKSANKEIKSILDLCEKGNELLKSVGGLDQSNEARAMLYLMDLESKGTQYNGWIMNLFDSALSLAEEDLGDNFWKTFNRDTIKADLRNLNSIPNKNITRLLARIRGVDLTQTLYKEVLLMTMDATRSYYTTMFKGLIKN